MPKPSPELLDPSIYHFMTVIKTRYSDLDPNNHINNVAMAGAFETARSDFLRETVALRGMANRPRIASVYVDYLAEAHYPGLLEIHVGLIDLGRTSWTVSQVARQNGVACAYCRSTLVLTQEGRPVPLDESWRRALETRRILPNAGH